jgi:hypothetical protein
VTVHAWSYVDIYYAMKKTANTILKARIRPVDAKDFPLIRALASEFPTFTVPSDYLLWFFVRFHPAYCRVLENESGNLKAYLLAMPTTEPQSGIAIWQVAAAEPDHGFTLEYFAAYLRDLVERTNASTLFFTTQQGSAALRLIRSLSKQFFGCDAVLLDPVPAGQGEYEFSLSIRTESLADQKNQPSK